MTHAPPFADASAAIEAAVKRVFPNAEATHTWDLDGWKVKLPHPPEIRGSMDTEWLYVLPAARKVGVTVHLWNPMSFKFLEESGGPLAEAGCKIMRGCFQFTRKEAFPGAALEEVLRAAKETF